MCIGWELPAILDQVVESAEYYVGTSMKRITWLPKTNNGRSGIRVVEDCLTNKVTSMLIVMGRQISTIPGSNRFKKHNYAIMKLVMSCHCSTAEDSLSWNGMLLCLAGLRIAGFPTTRALIFRQCQGRLQYYYLRIINAYQPLPTMMIQYLTLTAVWWPSFINTIPDYCWAV